ncbi:YycH family regulatory protein [Enterococcus sp.]|uniref:YycH family regulatory protein n=1 Tax=Enterococcus sp. TaxID=35783 RepID=UPI003C7737ED
MKVSEKIIRYGLIVLIALSFYLSYKIWLSPNARTYMGEDQPTVVANPTNIRKASDVFLPTRLVWMKSEEEIQMLSTEKAISTMHKELVKGRYGEVTVKTYEDDEAFLKDVDVVDAVEFNYFGSFQLYEYDKTYDLKMDLKDVDEGKDLYFSKVQVDFRNKVIRFINPRRHQIYQAEVKSSLKTMENRLLTIDDQWLPMAKDERLQSLQYNTQEKVTLQLYSYIASTQTYTVFRNAFFQDPENVKSSEESQDTVLYGGQETMRIQGDQQIVEFQGPVTSKAEDDIYDQSFQYVSRLETNVGYLRFFDRSKDRITYRTFIEGFPVFGDAYQGEVSFTLQASATGTPQVDIRSSLNTIQIPIPSDETVELPASQEVIADLTEKGADLELWESMVIGYQRQAVKNADGIVDMVPMWYIKYNDTWYSYAALAAELVAEKEAV